MLRRLPGFIRTCDDGIAHPQRYQRSVAMASQRTSASGACEQGIEAERRAWSVPSDEWNHLQTCLCVRSVAKDAKVATEPRVCKLDRKYSIQESIEWWTAAAPTA